MQLLSISKSLLNIRNISQYVPFSVLTLLIVQWEVNPSGKMPAPIIHKCSALRVWGIDATCSNYRKQNQCIKFFTILYRINYFLVIWRCWLSIKNGIWLPTILLFHQFSKISLRSLHEQMLTQWNWKIANKRLAVAYTTMGSLTRRQSNLTKGRIVAPKIHAPL